MKNDFFASPTDASRRKLQIVTSYFETWARILSARVSTIGYADLFAGPGVYDNGEKSIPIIICERVIADPKLRGTVKLWFNEGDADLVGRLRTNITAVQGIQSLGFPPTITQRVVTTALAPRLEKLSIPNLLFADPCGYKGLSLRLVASALKGFGNDCIFFSTTIA